MQALVAADAQGVRVDGAVQAGKKAQEDQMGERESLAGTGNRYIHRREQSSKKDGRQSIRRKNATEDLNLFV